MCATSHNTHKKVLTLKNSYNLHKASWNKASARLAQITHIAEQHSTKPVLFNLLFLTYQHQEQDSYVYHKILKTLLIYILYFFNLTL